MDESLKGSLRSVNTAEWKQKKVCYLGIKLFDNLQDMLEDNVLAYIGSLENMLQNWQKYGISFGGGGEREREMAVIKMKVWPLLLFLFQNLFIQILMHFRDRIQRLLNYF